MTAYYTRGIARPKGYYRLLDRRSTADAYDRPASCSTAPTSIASLTDAEDVYEVEGLISSRHRKVSNFKQRVVMGSQD